MKKKKHTPSLYLLVPWSFALIGLIVVLGNLFGLQNSGLPIIPVVRNLPGLLASSLFFFGLGLLVAFLQPLLRPRD